jgi:serine/threonine-protein kinase
MLLLIGITVAGQQSSSANQEGSTIRRSDLDPVQITTTTARTLTASQSLSQRAGADRASVQALVGSWSPQLSSKVSGTVDDNITYDNDAIWAEVGELESQYGPVVLLSSSDYPTFTQDGYWVVLAQRSFPTAGAANAWCNSQGLAPDKCFAKRLLTSGGPEGNTVHR